MKKLIILLPVFLLFCFSCKELNSSGNHDPNPLVSPENIIITSGDATQTVRLACSDNPDDAYLYDEDGDPVTVVLDPTTELPDCMSLNEETGVLVINRTCDISGTLRFWTVDDSDGSTEDEPLTVNYDITQWAPEPGDSAIYVAGYYTGTSNLAACYWKDGNKVDLQVPDGNDSEATSIFVYGNDVYVTGHHSDISSKTACYWKNGVRQDLDVPTFADDSEAFSIFVNYNAVYIAGYYDDNENSNMNYACYWKVVSNTVTYHDLQSAATAEAKGIYVSGNLVYVAGYYHDGDHESPYYWTDDAINGSAVNPVDLTWGEGTYGQATSILVSDSIVYISGYENDKSCYWTDAGTDSQTVLCTKDFAQAYSISLLGTDVYVAGRYYDSTDNVLQACYWKHNVTTSEIDLPHNNDTYSSANSIVLSAGKIHIVGYDVDVEDTGSTTEAAIYWNDTSSLSEVNLYNSTKAVANSIYVVE